MVPCSFEIKMLYLAIRIHKSSIMSVTTFTWLPRITSSFENIRSVQCVKLVWSHSCTSNQQSWILGQSQNICNKVSLAPLQKTQTGESTSCHWNKKWPVGSKLYNNLYWNHMRHFSCVVLKMLSKTAVVSILTRTLVHFSMHFGVSPVFTRHEQISVTLDLYKYHHTNASPITKFSITSKPSLLW